ncbi:MAG TPA: ribosome small subunit-dependent GTPase A [Cytophagaceae bacterium]
MKGVVIKSTGSWYDILGEDHNIYKGRLRGKFKIKNLNVTNPIAVGDYVEFEQEESADSSVIKDILPRENYIIRKSVQKSSQGHLIACNVDQTVLIVTLATPRTSLGFIDRFLVSAESFRIPAIIVFNKTDIYDETLKEQLNQVMNIYTQIGYTCLATSALENKGIEELKSLLRGKKSVLSGHSGVGKSSLINIIAPGLDLKTGEVSTFANKGVHTTTFAEMFEIEPGTFIIDTPGIKELGLYEIEEDELSHYFPEMRALIGECKFHNCRHVNEPQCAVLEKVKQGEIAESRYQSYLSMLSGEEKHR